MRFTLLLLSKAPPVPRFFKDADMSLNHFLIKGQVISLYRKLINVPKNYKWIRANFEKYRHERDLDKIKSLITSGQHQMHTLQGSVSLAQVSHH
ncbi:unnamed protein product [Cunninghamella blakesleeana]